MEQASKPKEIITIQKSSAFWKETFKKLLKTKRAVFAMVSITLLTLMAIFAPIIAPLDPNEIFLDAILITSSPRHPLGTDQFGRDILSRIIFGARISLTIGILTTLISTVIGVTVGSIAGYFGRTVDMVLSRFMEVMRAFPTLLFSMAILAILGPGTFNLFIALGLLGWVGIARMVRGQIIQLKEREYVEAAKASGAPAVWIIIKHMIPNCLPMIIISVSMGIPGNMLAEVGLSFIGLGVQPPTPSWGAMINQSRMFIRQVPMFSVYPGIAIMLMVFSFNMLGDSLRDALDPRLRDSV